MPKSLTLVLAALNENKWYCSHANMIRNTSIYVNKIRTVLENKVKAKYENEVNNTCFWTYMHYTVSFFFIKVTQY